MLTGRNNELNFILFNDYKLQLSYNLQLVLYTHNNNLIGIMVKC